MIFNIKINDMTNKVQKIREKVERLKSQLLRGVCSSQVAMENRCKEEAYNEVLAILDTMQEESTSKQNLSNVERNGKNWKESVSDDLEEASRNYADNEEYGDDVYFAIKAAFKAGAKWQFERAEEALLSEVLPCFMHGGEADEVVAKLDEVLNQK